MVSLKKKSESLIKYYIKVTCALKWARKLPRKTETYESAKCVPCNTRKCTHNGFVSDLLKWALKCRFYATGPWVLYKCLLLYVNNFEVKDEICRCVASLTIKCPVTWSLALILIPLCAFAPVPANLTWQLWCP